MAIRRRDPGRLLRLPSPGADGTRARGAPAAPQETPQEKETKEVEGQTPARGAGAEAVEKKKKEEIRSEVVDATRTEREKITASETFEDAGHLDTAALSVGGDRHLAPVGGAGNLSASPLGLRMQAMQDASRLGIDEGKAGSLLGDARGSLVEDIRPDQPLLHKKAGVSGQVQGPPSPLTGQTHVGEGDTTAEAGGKLGLDQGSASAQVKHTSTGDDGRVHTGQAGAQATATSSGVKVDASGQTGVQRTTESGGQVGAGARGGVKLNEQGQVNVDARAQASVKTTTDDGATVDAGGSGGVKVGPDGQVKVDAEGKISHTEDVEGGKQTTSAGGKVDLGAGEVQLNAGRTTTTTTERDDGTRVTTTVKNSATGSLKDLDFKGERTTSVREERHHEDGTRSIDETTRSVRGSAAKRNVEATYQKSETVVDGDESTTRTVKGSVGVRGVEGEVAWQEKNQATGDGVRTRVGGGFTGGRLNVSAERMNLSRENAPDGTTRDVEQGVGGKASVHRIGFTADVGFKDTDGQGGAVSRGLNVTYDPTGTSVNRTHGHTDAAGNASGGSEGVKFTRDTAGVTASTSSTVKLSDTESMSSTHVFDALLGNKKASGAWTMARTRSNVDETGILHQQSRSARLNADLEAFRTVSDKGPVQTDIPSLQGKHRVEVHQKTDGAGGLFVGQLTDGLGLFGGLSLQKGKEIKYTTHMGAARARAVAAADEAEGVGAEVRRRLVGASMLGSRVELPDLSDPDSLQVHDQVEVRTSGSITTALGVIAYGGRLATQAVLSGDFRLKVSKTDDHVVEVDVTPTRIRGLQGMAGVLLFDASTGRVSADAFGQTFRFDLSTESGRHAYLQTLEGKLPGGLNAKEVSAHDDGLAFGDGKDLPDGVERLRMEKVEVRESNLSGRVGWMFLARTTTRSKRETHHLVTDGEVSQNIHARTLENKRRTLLSGNEMEGVTAAVKVATAFGPDGEKVSAFESLTLAAHYSDDKVKGHELNKQVIQDLNRVFDAGLDEFGIKGRGEVRKVTATVSLDQEAIGLLRAATPEQVKAAAEATERSPLKLQKLIDALQATPEDDNAAGLIQKYVGDNGSTGMGQVLKLAGQEASLSFETSSSAYDAPLAEADKLKSRWKDGWDATASKKDLTRRFRELSRTQADLLDAQRRADDDPFLKQEPEKLAALKVELQKQHDELGALRSFKGLSHEEAVTVVQKLRRGWTSSTQQALINELIDELALKELSGHLRTRAMSQRGEEGGAVVTTRSVSDQSFITLFGDERTQVSAAVRTSSDEGRIVVDHVRLKASIVDTRSRLKEANQTVEKLNRDFGLSLQGLGEGESLEGARRTLDLTLTLDPRDLSRLNSLSADEVAARVAGTRKPARAAALAEALKKAPHHLKRADLIQDHVAEHGLDGMADVQALLQSEKIEVDATSDGYEKAAAGAFSLAKTYKDKVSLQTSTKDLAKRFKEAQKVEDRLKDAGIRLAQDGLLGEERVNAEANRLEEAWRRLDDVRDLGHLSHSDAAELVEKLRRGWTDKWEQQVIDRLHQDAGLVEVYEKEGGLIAHSSRVLEEGRVDVWSRREVARFASGDEQVLVTARRVAGDHASVEVQAVFSDTREQAGDLSENVVSRLNQSFGWALDDKKSLGDGTAREVELKLSLTPEDLTVFAAASAEQISAVSQRAGVEADEVQALVQGLRDSAIGGRGARVQRFISEYGVEGMGVVAQLAGKADDVERRTSSVGYQAALEKADAALAIYGNTPMRGDMTKTELTGRLRTIDQARKKLADTRPRIDADPLLQEADKKELLRQIDERDEELAACASFAGLSEQERAQLADTASSGWTSLWEGKLVRRIRQSA